MRTHRLKKKAIVAIIVTSLLIAAGVVIAIVNIFIPLKYLSVYFAKGEQREKNAMRVTMFDVGYGDCTFIELPDGKTMLIDCADGVYANQIKILSYLKGLDIEYIDYLVLSSVSDEHCGGIAELLDYVSVGCAYIPYCANKRVTDSYYAAITAITEKSVHCEIAESGVGGSGLSPSGEEYFFAFLSPSSHLSPLSEYVSLNNDYNAENKDNASAVLYLEYVGTSFVFTSDVRSASLEKLIAAYTVGEATGEGYAPYEGRIVDLSSCDVVTVSGHGNKKNTYAPWYDLLTPTLAVVSCGDNFNSEVSVEAVSNATGVGAEVLITDEQGDITFNVRADGYTYNTEK